MILQALTSLFEDLTRKGALSKPGWSSVKISYALCLDGDGRLESLVPQMQEEAVGKKTVLRPQTMELPSPVTRTVGVLPNFLWDNSSYLLGVDSKGKPERSKICFRACARLHHQLLEGIDTPTAKGILHFLDTWEPEKAQENTALKESWEDLMKGGNLVFRVAGIYPWEDPEICAAWDRHYAAEEGETVQCMVTGEQVVPEAVHPAIKGVAGAQSSGAALVSFNAPAFCSYGKEQSLNAPMGKYAAFAYTAALNYLLSDRENVQRIGDTTVVCWAEEAEPQYNLLANFAIFGMDTEAPITREELVAAVGRLAQGLPCPELGVEARQNFYILGIAPNSARLSVRFFYRSTFGELMAHIQAHHERMEIAGSREPMMPLWKLLRETVNLNSKDKSPSPVMAGAVARAIFAGTAYPASLLEATMLRIRSERNITPGRAAILKAYYLKNTHPQCPKEVLTVSLNENSTNIPYTLGRLFAIYEWVQETANPKINTTIKDKYFSSAAATPATIFPVLDNLAQKHLRKLKPGQQVDFDKKIGQIKNILGETYPVRQTLPEQGSFNLGYYHQKQNRYTKKEEK